MKNEKLYDAISDIREDFIEEAGNYKFKKKLAPRILKWGSLAACFCVLVLGAGLMMNGLLTRKGDGDVSNGSAVPTRTPGDSSGSAEPGNVTNSQLAYNGALYHISNDLNLLNIAGIPKIVGEEDCGRWLGNLEKTENGYEETASDTEIDMYEYASALSNSAVVVVKDGEEYMAGLFSNYFVPGEETYSPLSELYRAYGVKSATDIFMVTEVESSSSGVVTGEAITDSSCISQFYDATMSTESECYSWDNFREMILDNMSAAEFNRFTETERTICVETAEGLKFYVNWYPETGWLYSRGTLAYYKVTEELQNWLDTYMK